MLHSLLKIKTKWNKKQVRLVFILTRIVDYNVGNVSSFTSFLFPTDCFMYLEDEIGNSCLSPVLYNFLL
jgi:hypothetical protein